ncbi:MAG TPA: hypothetical protein DD670_09335 [Planctomycetaceae bacterium]|nr:hypothetical protein [Planctomycetaceae bacterium]
MSTSNAEGRLDPQALRLADLARALSAMGVRPVTLDMLQADIDAGAPANPDGTLSLIRYAAWLAKEAARRGD